MKKKTIKALESTPLKSNVQNHATTSGCCGGVPVTSEEACCKMDEDRKAEGSSGCGCITSVNIPGSSSCC